MNKPNIPPKPNKGNQLPQSGGCKVRHCAVAELDLIWECDHYDIPLAGLCREDIGICRFETDYETGESIVYKLSLTSKVKWLMRKKLFEICVGYHWSYPHIKRGVRFTLKKPKWFWKIIFNLYYGRRLNA